MMIINHSLYLVLHHYVSGNDDYDVEDDECANDDFDNYSDDDYGENYIYLDNKENVELPGWLGPQTRRSS